MAPRISTSSWRKKSQGLKIKKFQIYNRLVWSIWSRTWWRISINRFHEREASILYPSCFDANAGLFEQICGPEVLLKSYFYSITTKLACFFLRFPRMKKRNYLNYSLYWHCITSWIFNNLIGFVLLRMWSCLMSWTMPRSSMASDSPSQGSTGFAFLPFSFRFIVIESRMYMLSSSSLLLRC